MFAAFDDPQKFLVHDIRFHRAVAAASGNPILASLVEMVSALFYEQRRRTADQARDLRPTADMHHQIYQAIRDGRRSQAESRMSEHLLLAQREQETEANSSPSEAPHSRRALPPRRRRRLTHRSGLSFPPDRSAVGRGPSAQARLPPRRPYQRRSTRSTALAPACWTTPSSLTGLALRFHTAKIHRISHFVLDILLARRANSPSLIRLVLSTSEPRLARACTAV